MRRFYAPIENFSKDSVVLDANETLHLRDALRLVVGDEVSVFDGCGRESRCLITDIGKKSCDLSILEEIDPPAPESHLNITLAATVLNGEKYDLIVQKAVELGVVNLIPMHTMRGDVKTKDAANRLERWRRIAMEATKQCGRSRLMRIITPATVDAIVSDSDSDPIVLFSERGGVDFSTISVDKKITALIGPKGGWDDSELVKASAQDVKIVTLGGRIMRAETAAIALTTILQHRFGDLK